MTLLTDFASTMTRTATQPVSWSGETVGDSRPGVSAIASVEMGGLGIGLAGDLLTQPDGEFGAEDRGQVRLGGGVGEADGAVEAVVVGQGHRGQSR